MKVTVTFSLSEAGRKDAAKKGVNAKTTQSREADLEWNDDIEVDHEGQASLTLRTRYSKRQDGSLPSDDLYFDVYPEDLQEAYCVWAAKINAHFDAEKRKEEEAKLALEQVRQVIVDLIDELEETRKNLDFDKSVDSIQWRDIIDLECSAGGRIEKIESAFMMRLSSVSGKLSDFGSYYKLISDYYNTSAARSLLTKAKDKERKELHVQKLEEFKVWVKKSASERVQLLLKHNYDWKKPAREEWLAAHMPTQFICSADRPGHSLKVFDRDCPTKEELHDLEFWLQLLAGEKPEPKTELQAAWATEYAPEFEGVQLEWNIASFNNDEDYINRYATLVLTVNMPDGSTEEIYHVY